MAWNPSPKYSRAHEARQLQRGAVRLPGGMLPPEAAEALESLLAAGYARSKVGAIARALIEASGRMPTCGRRPFDDDPRSSLTTDDA